MFNIGKFFKNSFKTVKIQSENTENIGIYYLNDPDSPDLIEEQINYPELNNLPFNVLGYDPHKCNLNEAINCQMTLYRSISYFNQTYNKFHPLITKWAGTKKLIVKPKAGKDFNAYYNRKNLKFFYDLHPETKKMIHTANSVDIVAHEVGHGLLDAMRPDFWNVQIKEGWAFHEAFGDIQAIVTTTQSDKVIKKALEQTNGDLLQSNCISRLAEQLGDAVSDNNYLRDASVCFEYKRPEKLPKKAEPNQLSSECHSFSRIFTSAWYQCVIEIFNIIRKDKNDIEAFKEARDICYLYLLKAIKNVPNTPKLFDALARLILMADKENNSLYQNLLNDVFENQKILIPRIKMLSGKTLQDIKKDMKNSFMNIKGTNEHYYASVLTKRTIKLSDYVISAQTENAIYNAEIEIANDSFYVFDKEDNLIDEITEDQDMVINSAINCISLISEDSLLDDVWKIENNKLIRNYVDCGIC